MTLNAEAKVTRIDETEDRVIVFDTTLRDGEQAPGASMNLSQKLQVARALASLGVDVMEAGFPVASPGDFQAVEFFGCASGHHVWIAIGDFFDPSFKRRRVGGF